MIVHTRSRLRQTATLQIGLALCWLVSADFLIGAAEPARSVEERRDEIAALRAAAKYDQAIVLARQVLADVERDFGAESIEAAGVMDDLVNALGFAGKAGEGEALPLANRSLAIQRRGGDSRRLAESLLSLGTLQWRLNDYDDARRRLEESREVATRAFGPDDLFVAKAIENLALLDWTTGDYAEARGLLELTLRIRQARLEPGDDAIGRTLNNLAILHYQMGNYPLARQMYERSLQIRELTLGPDHPDTADVIDNLALVLKAQGDGPKARAMFERALDIRERSVGAEHPLVAISLLNVGETLQDAGELERALGLMMRALAIGEKTDGGRHRRVAGALEGIASVLLEMGRNDDARRSAERALALREEIAPGDERMSRALSLLSQAHEAQGDLQEALRLKARAVEVGERSLGGEHPGVATLLTDLGLLKVKLDDLDAAGKNFERALAIVETQLGRQHPEVASVYGPLASLQWQQGFPDRARASARRAGEIQDAALHSTLQDLPEQHALYMASRSVEPEVVLFSGLVNAGDGSPEWVAACWEWTLRRRGLVFDELARRQRAALVSDSPEMRAAWERLADARRQLAALWIRGAGEGDPKKYRDLLAAATQAKKSAETELARTTLAPQSDAPASRDEVRRAIPKGGVLVEVIRVEVSPPRSRERSRQDIALLLFSDGRMDFVRLGLSAGTDRLVDAWRQALDADFNRIATGEETADALDASRRAGIALRKTVWDPIAAKVATASATFLVPEGALHRVDLDALPLDDGRYLAESSRTIHLLSTGRDLIRFTGEAGRKWRAGSGLLALGAPDFGAAPGARLIATSRFRDAPAECLGLAARQWPPLPQSGIEVQEIAALAPSSIPVEVATGMAASEELFRREASKHDALHLATHGFFATEECASAAADRMGKGARLEPSWAGILGGNPLLLSGLVLAGADRGDNLLTDDGVLTAEEIAGLDLSGVRLAVLSACDTGLGKIAVAEGVFGLRRALEIAGVRTVVMSLWKVPDRETRRWMKSFYTALFGGAVAVDAARAASLNALRRLRAGDRPTHPYLWAGFVPVGDWR